tara:strand:- start:5819 stop:6070 length:252 start_codon:yes stop_codon:yes gene_type:complete
VDFIALLEQFGVPVVVALAFGFFIWKQNKFIQDELMEELDERFKRLEGIVIKLIDQQKLMQMDIKEYKGALRMFIRLLKQFKK